MLNESTNVRYLESEDQGPPRSEEGERENAYELLVILCMNNYKAFILLSV